MKTMETVKAGKPLLDFLRLCRAANRPPLLVGSHGVGKSELIEEAARIMGIACIVRDLSLMEPPDLIGLPTTKDRVTVFAPPAFLPKDGAGLLVFEELNRCEKYMRGPCLQLLTARTLNDYKLPEGWLPVAAINPADDDGTYQVEELDPALLSRFVVARVVACRQEWLGWAERGGVHPGVIRYVRGDATVFESPESNPRSWKYVSDILHAAAKTGASKCSLEAAILGILGTARGTAFMGTLDDVDAPLEAGEVLQNYDERQDRLHRWTATGRMDLVKGTLRNVLLELQPKDSYESVRRSHKQTGNVRKFLDDLPGDLKNEALTDFQERGYDFTSTPHARNRRAA